MSFKASVQYGDFEGTVAADHAANIDIGDYLRSRGLLQAREFLIAVELRVDDSRGRKPIQPCIRALVADIANCHGTVQDLISQNPIPVRVVELSITIDQFFKFFKQFSLTLTIRDGGLTHKEYCEI